MGLHVPFAPYRLVFFFFFALKQYLIIYLEESLRPIKLKKTKQNKTYKKSGKVTIITIIKLIALYKQEIIL